MMDASPPVESCCRTTETGAQVCALPADAKPAALTSKSTINAAHIPVLPVPLAVPREKVASSPQGIGQKLRTGALFAVACLASPCCTPILVPLLLALIPGTPLALWLGANLGWVYGGLTLLSVISAVALWRSLNRRSKTPAHTVRLSTTGEKAHVQF